MSIVRGQLPFERDYVQIPNAWMRDSRLSHKARGLLAELMTHKAGWVITIESLVAAGPDGRDSIRGAIAELEFNGYLERRRTRNDAGQLLGTDYHLVSPEHRETPTSDNPTLVQPTLVEPPTKNTIPSEHHLEEQYPAVSERVSNAKAPKRTANPSFIPAEWEPSPKALNWWKGKNLPAVDVSRETAKMKDWFTRNEVRRLDWNKTWMAWMAKIADREIDQPKRAGGQPWF